jgi:hypothetical protein
MVGNSICMITQSSSTPEHDGEWFVWRGNGDTLSHQGTWDPSSDKIDYWPTLAGAEAAIRQFAEREQAAGTQADQLSSPPVQSPDARLPACSSAEWKDADDSPPEYGVLVRVRCHDGVEFDACRATSDGKYLRENWGTFSGVRYWKPLAAPTPAPTCSADDGLDKIDARNERTDRDYEAMLATPAPAAEPHNFTLNPTIQRQVPGRYVTDDEPADVPAGKVGEKDNLFWPPADDIETLPYEVRHGRTREYVLMSARQLAELLTTTPCPRCEELAAEKESWQADAKLIWDKLQALAPWCESNDMEWIDEIICGFSGVEQNIEQLTAECERLRGGKWTDDELDALGDKLSCAWKLIADKRQENLDAALSKLLAAEAELAELRVKLSAQIDAQLAFVRDFDAAIRAKCQHHGIELPVIEGPIDQAIGQWLAELRGRVPNA